MVKAITATYRNEILPHFSIEPTSVKTVANSLFAKFKEMNTNALTSTRHLYELMADPIEVLLGGLWSICLAVDTYNVVRSFRNLYTAVRIERLPAESFERINLAIKNAFFHIISFVGTCAYTAHWADKVRIITLGAHAPFAYGLGVGGTLIINTIESGRAFYRLNKEKEASEAEMSLTEREKHKQHFYLSFMKLIGNVCMVAWSVLSIPALVFSISFSPVLMLGLLCMSTSFSVLAYMWECELKKQAASSLVPPSNQPAAA